MLGYRGSVLRMNRYSAIRRSAAAALFALLMAVRLLSPAGFMPAFDHGSVSIVVCPDGDPVPTPMAHHQHHGDAKLQQHCPYAAGGAPATATNFILVSAALLAAGLLISGVAFEHFRRHRLRDWPPSIGPPLPA
jgi:hypothetical protein